MDIFTTEIRDNIKNYRISLKGEQFIRSGGYLTQAAVNEEKVKAEAKISELQKEKLELEIKGLRRKIPYAIAGWFFGLISAFIIMYVNSIYTDKKIVNQDTSQQLLKATVKPDSIQTSKSKNPPAPNTR